MLGGTPHARSREGTRQWPTLVLYEVSDGLATVTLNRPDAMNALNTEAKVALRESLEAAAADPAVRAVLLTAAGRAFCVGQDLKEHVRGLGGDEPMRTVREHYNPIVRAITGMPKPVVAGVNGVAAGAASASPWRRDYRVVADTAILQHRFRGGGPGRRLGHVLDAAPPRRPEPRRRPAVLPRTVSAQEAAELGIVNRLVPRRSWRPRHWPWPARWRQGPTVAYAGLKEAMAYGAGRGLAEALEKEEELQSRAGTSEDHRIAVEAFLAKEKPAYVGR